MAIVICIATVLSVVASVAAEHGNAYSFNHFEGPVSGPVVKITVPHGLKYTAHGGQTFDYVAKPDYKFAYGVEDPHHGNSQRRKEVRDGDKVQGEYSLIEPDGSLRVVKYTADHKNGFQAVVHHTPPYGNKPATVTQHLTNGGNQQQQQQQQQHPAAPEQQRVEAVSEATQEEDEEDQGEETSVEEAPAVARYRDDSREDHAADGSDEGSPSRYRNESEDDSRQRGHDEDEDSDEHGY